VFNAKKAIDLLENVNTYVAVRRGARAEKGAQTPRGLVRRLQSPTITGIFRWLTNEILSILFF